MDTSILIYRNVNILYYYKYDEECIIMYINLNERLSFSFQLLYFIEYIILYKLIKTLPSTRKINRFAFDVLFQT